VWSFDSEAILEEERLKAKPCQTEPLASSEACEVWVCSDCGVVHFHMGPISLRFKPDHFAAITATLQHASSKLRQRGNGFETGLPLKPLNLNH
jgi:hypothetical protein